MHAFLWKEYEYESKSMSAFLRHNQPKINKPQLVTKNLLELTFLNISRNIKNLNFLKTSLIYLFFDFGGST